MDDNTVYRKTPKGLQEIAERTTGLAQKLRRALILIDGVKDAAELSVLMRPGEAEETLAELVGGGYIERVSGSELNPDRVTYVPAANDPESFLKIKQFAIARLAEKIGTEAGPAISEIRRCNSAVELRLALRFIENDLVAALGVGKGVELACEIGAQLTRMVPRKPR